MRRVSLIVLLGAALLFSTGFRLVQGGDTTLASGETYEGLMLFTGGNYTVEDGATIDGDVWMIGGNVNLYGEITGDVHLYGGELSVQAGGSVGGEFIDQRTVNSGGDGFSVVDIGFTAVLLCCGPPILLIVLLIVLLVRRRKRKAMPQTANTPAAGA